MQVRYKFFPWDRQNEKPSRALGPHRGVYRSGRKEFLKCTHPVILEVWLLLSIRVE